MSDARARGKASRSKGSRGESEARKVFTEGGFSCVPWRGGVDGPDFIAIGDGAGLVFSVEVTRDKARIPKGLYTNMEKAKKGPGAPVSVVRLDREEWIAQLPLSLLFQLMKGS